MCTPPATLFIALARLAFLALFALPAQAILTRADRDDEEYRELATRYPSAVALHAPEGAGVLIAPRWVLTAAHRAKGLQEMKTLPKLDFAGRAHAIQAVYVHPEWKRGGHSDIALLLLREPVEGVEPTPIYREPDEAGQTARIVGFGQTGRIGGQPPEQGQQDRQRRAAVNTVDRVTPLTLGLRIKGPEEASDLQGALAPGETGAPAFFEREGRIFVAGIGYATDDATGSGNVGQWEFYVRVSAFANWIDQVMFRAASDEAAATVRKR